MHNSNRMNCLNYGIIFLVLTLVSFTRPSYAETLIALQKRKDIKVEKEEVKNKNKLKKEKHGDFTEDEKQALLDEIKKFEEDEKVEIDMAKKAK